MARPPPYLHRRYRLLGALGEGGLATAYRVWDEATEEERALKLVSADAVELLRNEFALLAGVFHPRVVRVHDFGVFRSEDGRGGGFYTAELLSGTPLAVFAGSHPWAASRAALLDALEGLAFLHRLGIRHGDFKPDNIIVDAAGRATLLDLSCASRLSTPIAQLSGTVGYIAPELAIGRVVDTRADLFSVGVTLRELADVAEAGVARLVAELTRELPGERPAEVADVLAALGDERAPGRVTSGRSAQLLGRGPEMAAFGDMLHALVRDEPGPRGLLLCGPSGIGKSRLLEEMKWRAQLTSDVTEAARPVGDERRPDALRSLLRRAGASLDTTAGTISLAAALRAADELSLGPRPAVLCIDDAERLSPRELAHLEAILRSLPRDGRLLVVVTASRRLAEDASQLEIRELTPLDTDAIRAWAGTLVTPRRLPALARLTAGHPAYLEAAVRQLASGTLLEEDLASTPQLDDAWRMAPELERASEDARDLLALVVAWEGRLPAGQIADDEPLLGTLAADGWVVPEQEGYRLARPADEAAIAHALGEARMTRAHRVVAEKARDRATRVSSWVYVKAVAEAERAFHDPATDAAPRRWSNAMHALAGVSRTPAVLLAIGAAQLELGRSRRALTAVVRLLRTRPPGAMRTRAWTLAGTIYLQREIPRRAVRYLTRALEETPADRAVAALLVRALNQIGAYARAAELATGHLASAVDDDAAIELSAGLGVAATYLGESELAEQHLRRAATRFSEERHPRDAARARSYLAILAFRSGDVETAASEYERALDIAERREQSDMLPTLVLNLGTARQQLGAWGEAISLYERGHRVAVALGKIHARALLELNLANLFADIGLADRAAGMLTAAVKSASRAGIVHLDGQQHTIAAEIALAKGDWAAARACFERARAVHEKQGDAREAAEVCIHIAAITLSSDWAAAPLARRELERARRTIEGVDARDVRARLEITLGLCVLAENEVATAVSAITRGLALAEEGGQPLALAEALAALARAKRAGREHGEAAQLEERARSRWRDVVATLPRSMHDAFWRHPRRRDVAPGPNEAPERARTLGSERLRRVLELSARVSSSLSLDRVLELAMDAAIELTGAERGFLLLRSFDEATTAMHVAVARNVERERLKRGDLEFSNGIAERVLESGEPVITLDARGDARFKENRSVHAMRLKSVVCVPVAAQGSVLGALYLDNRFEHGRFGEDDIDVVLAFSSHVAMAVRNARLHAALEENNRRLAAEKRRVERLSRAQARHIEQLEERVRAQQATLERRYDYAAIVHRSRAMSDVLDVLDRVIDSDLTVLVEGESGTGKELVARAVHFNSPRRERPFVSVNCGALSETLLESELFGHVRGAFTGADRERPGLMVAANGGTLFLDEIGELPLTMQVKLLRALQEKEVRPVGAVEPVALDLRIVCATNRHLRDEVEGGRFREDLYYRLAVVEVRLPALRDREDDILPIARTLLARQAEKSNVEPPEIGRDAARAMLRYRWPGNVRQLENVLARAYVLSDRKTLHESELDLAAAPRAQKRPHSREEFERGEAERIHDTLLAHRWNVSRTARALGIPRNTLYRKMQRLGITRDLR